MLENSFKYKKKGHIKPNPSNSQTLIKLDGKKVDKVDEKKGIFLKSNPNSISTISNPHLSKQSTKNNHCSFNTKILYIKY